MNNTMPNYKNLSLEDLPNEIWVDCIGYDGVYNVSNLGRIKSLERYVNGRNGGERLVKSRILKQNSIKSSMGVQLNNEGIGVSYLVSGLIYRSFKKDDPIKPLEVIMHIDKDYTNNSLCNLKIDSCKESTRQNFLKGKQTLEKVNVNLKKAIDRNLNFYSSRTHKTCYDCGRTLLISLFVVQHSQCKECYNFKKKEQRKVYVEFRTEKKCTKCNEVKEINLFPKHTKSYCKECVRIYMIERRNKI